MPNVLLTQLCVRSCPYCFAKKQMSESSSENMLSWENLIYLADLFQSGGERRFPLLGGEPSLHPDFNHMILYLLERDFDVNVFTSGIMSARTLGEASQLFNNIPPNRLTFICNLNDPDKTPTQRAETESIKRFLKTFGERITPGFNIYRIDFNLEFLFHYINEFGLHRHIRLGLTHPIVGRKNKFITLHNIDTIIDRLFSYSALFERLRIKPGLDCGFPMCRFSDTQLAWLYRHTGGKYDFGCGPVVDIGPDMTIWPCFPLSSFQRRSVFEFDSLREIYDFYQNIHNKIKVEASGIYVACDSCICKDDHLCEGGCLAHNLNHFQQEAKLRLQEVYL